MITMFAEVFEDGEWHKVGKIFPSALPELEGQLTDRVYDGTNLELEKILSGKGYDPFERLDIFTGVAEDTSLEIAGHKSFTNKEVRHVYISNLIAFLYTYDVFKTGYITEWQYKRLKKQGHSPVAIRKNIPRAVGIKVTSQEMDMILNNPDLRKEDTKYFVQYKYGNHPFREDCAFFWNETLPVLTGLYEKYENVRIVYGMKE